MIKKIMVATDGSETSAKAVKLGIEIACLSHGTVTAVYVVDIIRLARLPGYTVLPGSKDKLLDLMQKESKKATLEVEEWSMEAGVPFQKIVGEGDPAEELIRISYEIGADLLVMGSVGRTGLNRFLLGSVAEKVVHHASVPVMLVPGNSKQ